MKKLLNIILLVLCAIIAQAQSNIAALEYFIDDDPGLGNGTAITIPAGASVAIQHSIDIPSLALSNGMHLIVIRSQNLDGDWSFYESRSFLISGTTGNPVPPVENIVALEYFIDDDPGEGAGTGIDMSSGSTVDIQHSVDFSGLEAGYHKIGLRAQKESGDWGMYEVRNFLISEVLGNPVPPVSDIVAVEYFIDDDPGQGNGTSITVASGASLDLNESIAGTLDKGWHTVNIRAQNAIGQWGFCEKRKFYVQSAPTLNTDVSDIVKMEYFFNEDPGVGQATEYVVGPGAVVDMTSLILESQGTLPTGTNTFNVRAQNAIGRWGFTETRDFEVLDDCTQPIANFDMALGCAGEPVSFTDQSTNLQLDATYIWYLDGEEIADEIGTSLTMTIDNPGDYTMSMAVRQGQICKDSIGMNFTIKEKPIVVFSADPVVLGNPTVYEVESFYVDPAAAWSWDFENDATVDDGTVGNNAFTFESTGSFNTSLTVTDGMGCTANYSKTVVVMTEVISKIVPSISLSIPVKTYGDASFELEAITDSDGTISYLSSDAAVLTIAGSTATIVGAGVCEVTTSILETDAYLSSEKSKVLIVEKASLTARADDQTRMYRKENPVLTISYEGFVNEDAAEDIARPIIFTTANIDSPEGTYDIFLNSGSSENYTITLVNGTMTIIPSDVLSVSALEAGIRIYPSPVKEMLKVEMEKPIDKISIFNAQGKNVLIVLENFDKIDVRLLPSGIYLMMIEMEGRLLHHKIVKR